MLVRIVRSDGVCKDLVEIKTCAVTGVERIFENGDFVPIEVRKEKRDSLAVPISNRERMIEGLVELGSAIWIDCMITGVDAKCNRNIGFFAL